MRTKYKPLALRALLFLLYPYAETSFAWYGITSLRSVIPFRGEMLKKPLALRALLFLLYPYAETSFAWGITKKALHISVKGFLSRWRDSNPRPPAPKAGTLTGLCYTSKNLSFYRYKSGCKTITFFDFYKQKQTIV
jgi:hypothetical protein